MVDTLDIRRVIEEALKNAQAAALGIPQQIEHAVRALIQMYPELSEREFDEIRLQPHPYEFFLYYDI